MADRNSCQTAEGLAQARPTAAELTELRSKVKRIMATKPQAGLHWGTSKVGAYSTKVSVNGRAKVIQKVAQNVVTLGLTGTPCRRPPPSGRPRFSHRWRLPGCVGPHGPTGLGEISLKVHGARLGHQSGRRPPDLRQPRKHGLRPAFSSAHAEGEDGKDIAIWTVSGSLHPVKTG
jgi:hypothetical protein